MKVIKDREINAGKISEAIIKGELVIMPTETMYGAMVDATNQNAVNKLIRYKKRPFGKPFSVAVNSLSMAKDYVEINANTEKLYKTFFPGPVTIITKGKNKLAPGVESEDNKLGIRIPDYKLVLDVIKIIKRPITATSANASYKKRPYKIEDILDNLTYKQKKLIDLIVDVGELPHNEPSTVIDVSSDNDTIVLRQGEVKIGKVKEVTSLSPEATKNIAKEIWQKYQDKYKKRPFIFALEGEMGSGKTIFTKGLAKAIGIKHEVDSPSYDLIHEYPSPTKGKLIHLDTWRMIDPEEETNDLDIISSIKNNDVVVIEWADRIQKLLENSREDAVIIWVKIRYGLKNDERLLSWGVL